MKVVFSVKYWLVMVCLACRSRSLACSSSQANHLKGVKTDCDNEDYGKHYNLEILPERWDVPNSHIQVVNSSIVWSYHTNVTNDIGGFKLWYYDDNFCHLVILQKTKYQNCFQVAIPQILKNVAIPYIQPLITSGKLKRLQWKAKWYTNITGNNVQVDFRLQDAKPSTFILYLENGTLVNIIQIKDMQSMVELRGLASGKYYFRLGDIKNNMDEDHCTCRLEALGLKQCTPYCEDVQSKIFQIPSTSRKENCSTSGSTRSKITQPCIEVFPNLDGRNPVVRVILPIIITIMLVFFVMCTVFCFRRHFTCSSRRPKPTLRIFYQSGSQLHNLVVNCLSDVLKLGYFVTVFIADDLKPNLDDISVEVRNYDYEIVILGGHGVPSIFASSIKDLHINADSNCLVVSYIAIVSDVLTHMHSFYLPNDIQKLLCHLKIRTKLNCPFSRMSRSMKKLRCALQKASEANDHLPVDVNRFAEKSNLFDVNWIPRYETESVYGIYCHAYEPFSDQTGCSCKDHVDEESISIGEKSV